MPKLINERLDTVAVVSKTNKEELRRLLIILNIFWTQSQYYLFDTGAPAEICGHEFVFNVI